LTEHTANVSGLSFSPDGSLLATEGEDPDAVRIWHMDMDSPDTFGRQLAVLEGAKAGSLGSTINFLPDNRRVIFLGKDGQLKVWDVKDQIELLSFACAPAPHAVVVNPAGTIVASTNVDGVIKLCSLGATYEWQTITYADPNRFGAYTDSKRFYDVAFNNEGTMMYTANIDGKVSAWDATEPGSYNSGQEILLIDKPDNRFYDVEISRRGDMLTAAAFDGSAYLWDAKTGQELATFGEHDDHLWKVAFSPDGNQLAAANRFGAPTIWNLITGEAIFISTRLFDSTDVAFSPDGQLLVISSGSMVICIEIATGVERFRLTFEGGVWAVEFSPDGRYLATAGNDTTVHLWNMTEFDDDGLPKEIRRKTSHLALITGLAFSPDGKLLASGSFDRTVRIWNVATGAELLTLPVHTNNVWGVAFNPDGKRLATARWDGTVRVFLLNLDELIELARSRLTRWFTLDECRQYLHTDTCPPPPWER
jgi:WD40 repeat protein